MGLGIWGLEFESLGFSVWLYKGLEFPKSRGTLFWGPDNKTIPGTILGSPYLGKLPDEFWELRG